MLPQDFDIRVAATDTETEVFGICLSVFLIPAQSPTRAGPRRVGGHKFFAQGRGTQILHLGNSRCSPFRPSSLTLVPKRSSGFEVDQLFEVSYSCVGHLRVLKGQRISFASQLHGMAIARVNSNSERMLNWNRRR